MEFQRRGAPHLHILSPVPASVPAFRCLICGDTKRRCTSFRHWVSQAWAKSVNADRESGEFRRNLLAGTGIDRDRKNSGAKMTDPRRLATYFLKHGMGGGKEYQHEAPAEWLASVPAPLTAESPVQDLEDFNDDDSATGLGRFWGYKGLKRGAAVVPVSRAEYHFVRRTLRRLNRSKKRCQIVQHETVTGSPYKMVQGVRQAYWTRSGPGEARESGLWVSFNDAPAVLSGLVAVMRSPGPVPSFLQAVRTVESLLGASVGESIHV
ncbi:MAG: hypothetical protein WCI74_16925 [Actinomycetes bacterium]